MLGSLGSPTLSSSTLSTSTTPRRSCQSLTRTKDTNSYNSFSSKRPAKGKLSIFLLMVDIDCWRVGFRPVPTLDNTSGSRTTIPRRLSLLGTVTRARLPVSGVSSNRSSLRGNGLLEGRSPSLIYHSSRTFPTFLSLNWVNCAYCIIDIVGTKVLLVARSKARTSALTNSQQLPRKYLLYIPHRTHLTWIFSWRQKLLALDAIKKAYAERTRALQG